MKLTKIETHLLNSLCDDYENISSIQPDLLNVLHEKLSNDSIVRYLKKLADIGLIDVYKYDVNKYLFVKQIDLPDIEYADAWFLINNRGREELDINWEGEN